MVIKNMTYRFKTIGVFLKFTSSFCTRKEFENSYLAVRKLHIFSTIVLLPASLYAKEKRKKVKHDNKCIHIRTGKKYAIYLAEKKIQFLFISEIYS